MQDRDQISSIEEYIKCGDAYCGKRKFDKAIIEYSYALYLDSENAEVCAKRAAAYLDHYNHGLDFIQRAASDQLFMASQVDYKKAVRLDPNNSLAYTVRGDVIRCTFGLDCAGYSENQRQVNYHVAISNYTIALRLDPQNKRASRGLIKMIEKMSLTNIRKVVNGLPDDLKTVLLTQCFDPNTLFGKVFIPKNGFYFFKNEKLKGVSDYLKTLAPDFVLSTSVSVAANSVLPSKQKVDELHQVRSAIAMHNRL